MSDPGEKIEENECASCGVEGTRRAECWASKRPCGHHCNCSWEHDHCHWCGACVDLDGEWPEGLRQEANTQAWMPTGMCGATKKCPSCPSTFLCQMKVNDEAKLIAARDA